MALIKKTKAEMEPRIRGAMKSALYWSVWAFKNNNMMLAVAESQVALKMSELLSDAHFVEVAHRQCSIAEINYDEWFKKVSGAYSEALAKE